MIRKWDSENEVVQRKCIDEIVARIDEIGDSSPGVIAAQDIIDIVTENLGPEIYNKGIGDAKKLIGTKMADLEVDLEALKQSIR